MDEVTASTELTTVDTHAAVSFLCYNFAGPTKSPSVSPTAAPSAAPTASSPSRIPSKTPSGSPSKLPSATPSYTPSVQPSTRPSNIPSITPTVNPTYNPSLTPTFSPTFGDDLYRAAPGDECVGDFLHCGFMHLVRRLETSEQTSNIASDIKLNGDWTIWFWLRPKY
eukprot:TRINITY_DN1589_c0_g1_i1.p1 TRINITY_DN1589_c0_g1~~TRINITY_DN1589_c0_g1_i1.p1  ORF type:complete len:167 (+),score=14.47 TRINITY_DN1589_c0_g1_i1:705-1205(+)